MDPHSPPLSDSHRMPPFPDSPTPPTSPAPSREKDTYVVKIQEPTTDSSAAKSANNNSSSSSTVVTGSVVCGATATGSGKPTSYKAKFTKERDAKQHEKGQDTMASLRLAIAIAVVIPSAVFTVSHSYVLYNWKGGRVIEWLCGHPEIPLSLAAMYLCFVFISPKFISENISGFFANSEVLKCFLSIWNLFFSVFSSLGFFYSVPFLYKMLLGKPITGLAAKTNRVTGVTEAAPTNMNGSFVNSLCYWNANVFQDGMGAFWLLAFDLSKIIEMMDTVFLVLKGKKVIFLHWYHHLTVMLFCWHAHVTYISNGLWFAVMNMGIHTIMYFYYFCFSCGLGNRVKAFAQLITALQILQMVAGLVLQLCTLFYYVKLRWEHATLQNGANCDTNFMSLLFGLVMYGSYFVLFISFFVRAYGKKKERSGKRGASGNSSSSSTSSHVNRSASSSVPASASVASSPSSPVVSSHSASYVSAES